MDKYELINNTDKNQYEFHIDGYIAKIEYDLFEGKIFLIHTEVPEQLEGRGIASQLAVNVFKDIESKGWKLVAECPFIAGYINKHPEWNKLVVK